MARLFGTDGVRGVANVRLDCPLAYQLGKYGARVLQEHFQVEGSVVIGHDGRISADMLASSLAAGFMSEGLDVYPIGLIPTPGLAYTTKTGPYALGAMVSASHNSFEHNGIKFFDHSGQKLPDVLEDRIEAYIQGWIADTLPPLEGADLGRIHRSDDAVKTYGEYLLSRFSPEGRGRKIGLDLANGATSILAKELFENLGFDVEVLLGAQPDGTNINASCGSTHPEQLSRAIKESDCQMGFAFDGDGDRLIALDKDGQIIDGDRIMAVLALAYQKQGLLKGKSLVATIMSNLGLDKFCEKNGITLYKTQVGDRYVLEKLISDNLVLGGEQSGHIILRDHQTTGDGLLSALALISALDSLDMDLSQIDEVMTLYPQCLKNVPVLHEMKGKIMADTKLKDEIDRTEKALDGRGRILVRASGTEDLIRVMVEAETEDKAHEIADYFVNFIKESYN
jgi:phosphoglucosamine mutase